MIVHVSLIIFKRQCLIRCKNRTTNKNGRNVDCFSYIQCTLISLEWTGVKHPQEGHNISVSRECFLLSLYWQFTGLAVGVLSIEKHPPFPHKMEIPNKTSKGVACTGTIIHVRLHQSHLGFELTATNLQFQETTAVLTNLPQQNYTSPTTCPEQPKERTESP